METGDGNLLAGMVLDLLAVLLFMALAAHKYFEYSRSKSKSDRMISIGSVAVVVGLILFYGQGFLVNLNLMTNATYVEGKTISYCRTGKYQGIEFEYYVGNQRYTNCMTYKDTELIKVPGGRFKVRVSEYDPTIGLINFDEPLRGD